MAKRFNRIDAVIPEVLAEAKADYPESIAPKVVDPKQFASVTPEFLFAGKAHMLVKNDKGDSFMYAVRAREGKGRYAGQLTYFLRVKATGSRFPYRYVGIVKTDGVLVPAGRSEFLPGSKQFDVAAWAVKIIVDKTPVPPGYYIGHDGTCGKCNRSLISEDEKIHGFDELCWKTVSEGNVTT